MSRCSNCGRESSPGTLYCQNCGHGLAAGEKTADAGAGLSGTARCPSCAVENPPGMSFCRNCGSRLGAPEPRMPSPAPAGSRAGSYPPPAQASQPAGQAPGQSPAAANPVRGPAPMQSCPHCNGQTPAGYAFCQQCGNKLPAAGRGLVGPGTERRPLVVSGETRSDPFGPTSAVSPVGPTMAAGQSPLAGTPEARSPVDAVGPTMASGQSPLAGSQLGVVPAIGKAAVDAVGPTMASGQSPLAVSPLGGPAMTGKPAGSGRVASPTPPSGTRPSELGAPDAAAHWGMLVGINRDGSDGQPYPLSGEWIEIGRDSADVSFPDDRFLARRHARIERTPGGVRIVPLDSFNGVYVRITEPTPLQDGDILLFGREVMRFELVAPEERDARPLVRHGVALFGSPPREPWGRLLQLLASGGVRDIRHLTLPTVTLGREEGDIVFRDDQFLSRRHATFTFRDGACLIEDLQSSNGTFVRLPGPTGLESGMYVRAGDQVFRVELDL